MTLLPAPEHVTQADADALLHKQVRVDAERAGWLRPCAQKPGHRRSLFYRTFDVREVSRRISEGEYPGVTREASAVL
jgi:hypothetical protein